MAYKTSELAKSIINDIFDKLPLMKTLARPIMQYSKSPITKNEYSNNQLFIITPGKEKWKINIESVEKNNQRRNSSIKASISSSRQSYATCREEFEINMKPPNFINDITKIGLEEHKGKNNILNVMFNDHNSKRNKTEKEIALTLERSPSNDITTTDDQAAFNEFDDSDSANIESDSSEDESTKSIPTLNTIGGFTINPFKNSSKSISQNKRMIYRNEEISRSSISHVSCGYFISSKINDISNYAESNEYCTII